MKKRIIPMLLCVAVLASAGISASAYTRADTTGDSVVNSKDLVRVMKTIADGLTGKIEDFPEDEKRRMLACDVNGDGILNSHDLVSLMKFIAEGKSDTDATETNAPDTDAPDTDGPEIVTPDTSVPDTDAPDTNAPDTGVLDTDMPDTDTPDTDAPDTDTPETDVPGLTPDFSSFEGERLPFTVLWSGNFYQTSRSHHEFTYLDWVMFADTPFEISTLVQPYEEKELFEDMIESTDTENNLLLGIALKTGIYNETPFSISELVLHDESVTALLTNNYDGSNRGPEIIYMIIISVPRDALPEGFQDMQFGVSIFNTDPHASELPDVSLKYHEAFPHIHSLPKYDFDKELVTPPDFSSFEGERLPFSVLWRGECRVRGIYDGVLFADSSNDMISAFAPIYNQSLSSLEAALEGVDTESNLLMAFVLSTNGGDIPFSLRELVLHDGMAVGLFTSHYSSLGNESISGYAVVISVPRDALPENFRDMPFGASIANIAYNWSDFAAMYYHDPFPYIYPLFK